MSKNTVAELVNQIDGPINVVMGLSGSNVSMDELAEMGFRRVSVGGSLARSLYFTMREAALEMREKGTFSYAKNQVAQQELNNLFER